MRIIFFFVKTQLLAMFLAGLLCKNDDGKVCLEMRLSADNKKPEKVPLEEIVEEFLDRQVLFRIDPVELR